MELKSPSLIIISAPSGAGKSTLCNMLVDHYKDIKYSISCTTRKPRGDEKNGMHYFFMDDSEFIINKSEGNFLEYAKVHDNWYGTLKKTIGADLSNNFSVVLDIDIQGAKSIRDYFEIGKGIWKIDGTELHYDYFDIFIHPPSLNILEQRLKERGVNSDEEISRRIAEAKKEVEGSSEFQFQLVNDDLNKTYKELSKIIKDPHSKKKTS